MKKIKINDSIKEIRNDSIKLLLELFENERDWKYSEKIIAALFNSASPIHHGSPAEENTKTIRENIETTLFFIYTNYDKLKNHDKRCIEKNLRWFSRRKEEIEKLQEVQTKLSSDEDYLKYITFVGYDLDYGSDFESIEKEKKRRIESYVAQVTENNQC